MFKDLLLDRIKEYDPKNEIEQELVLQEIMQQYILVSLAGSGFFNEAQFHGGTCLKIIHNLKRFSEDLDFVLKEGNSKFHWQMILESVKKDLTKDGIDFEVVDKSKFEGAVRKTFIKTNSVGKILRINLPYSRHQYKKIKIKLEIDCIPPEGSKFETHYLHFPITVPITTQALPSGFAGKIHALLCRDYTKGRDWYDFIWYISKNIKVNFELLKNALFQLGPWKGEKIMLTKEWLKDVFTQKIDSIKWKEAADDVSRFLPLEEQSSLSKWEKNLFLYHLEKVKFFDVEN